MAQKAKFLGGISAENRSFRRCLNVNHLFPCCCVSFRENVKPSQQVRRSVAFAVVKRSPKRLKYVVPRLPRDGRLVYVEVDPSGSDAWKLDQVVELLKEGAVGVIPTDTVYAMVCDLKNNSAIERLRRIKDIEPSKPLSILCCSFHDIDTYTMGFPRGNDCGVTNIFRAVKHCLPGPYTFILTASKGLPKQCIRYGTKTSKHALRRNVGVRIPADPVCQAILEKMDAPLISTSVRSLEENDWILDPVAIANIYGPEVLFLSSYDFPRIRNPMVDLTGLDFVVDADIRVADPSTVVDMTGSMPRIVRQGKGPKQPWMVAEDPLTVIQ